MESCLNFEATDLQIQKEESRIVKICLVKYKCILIALFVIICLVQFALLLLNKPFNSDLFIQQFQSLIANFSSKNV